MALSASQIYNGCIFGSLASLPTNFEKKRSSRRGDCASMRSQPSGFHRPAIHKMSSRQSNQRYCRMGVEARAGVKVAPPSHGYDYYELLGVDSAASIGDIKKAYRWLQKRCHPDVDQELGHDMAILLNEAYATLVDEDARAVYDQMRVLLFADNDYTGEPLYSTWHGHEEEDRAIFVDETQCVGCLKCALIAKNTFAIETSHGRARAVKQWGDHQDTVFDAITACPVDCIKLVEKAKLPALEYVMAKQSRIPVGIDCHNNGGKRVVNVFTEAQRFIEKLEYRRKNRRSTEEGPGQREAREAAAAAIQARAGRWWYRWATSFSSGESESATWRWTNARQSRSALLHLGADVASAVAFAEAAEAVARRGGPAGGSARGSGAAKDEDLEMGEELRLLKEAAEARRAAGVAGSAPRARPTGRQVDEYWKPDQRVKQTPQEEQPAASGPAAEEEEIVEEAVIPEHWQRISTNSPLFRQEGRPMEQVMNILAGGPLMVAAAAAMYVLTTTADTSPSMAAIESPLPAELTSGLMGRVLMASLAWYLIGAVVSGLIAMASAILYDRQLNVEETACEKDEAREEQK